MSETVFITAEEALAMLPFKRKKFYELVKREIIPRVVLPGMTYGKYRASDIRAYLQQSTPKSATR